MANERKWTGGPWSATRSDPAEGFDVWWLTAGAGNAETDIGSITGGKLLGKSEANAHLAAAAPDLFEALQAAMPFIDDAEDVYSIFPDSAATAKCREMVAKARAALSKAEGR